MQVPSVSHFVYLIQLNFKYDQALVKIILKIPRYHPEKDNLRLVESRLLQVVLAWHVAAPLPPWLGFPGSGNCRLQVPRNVFREQEVFKKNSAINVSKKIITSLFYHLASCQPTLIEKQKRERKIKFLSIF